MARNTLASDFMILGVFSVVMYIMYTKGHLAPLVDQLKDVGLIPVNFPSKPTGGTTTPPPATPPATPPVTPPADEEEGGGGDEEEGGDSDEEESGYARALRVRSFARMMALERKYGFRVRLA